MYKYFMYKQNLTFQNFSQIESWQPRKTIACSAMPTSTNHTKHGINCIEHSKIWQSSRTSDIVVEILREGGSNNTCKCH